IITWSSVPGAASYEVEVTRYALGHCNWAAPLATEKQTSETATTAWTPLGAHSAHIGPTAWPRAVSRVELAAGNEYCVRVVARTVHDAKGNQVASEWTHVGGLDRLALALEAVPSETTEPGLETPGTADR